MKDHLYRILIFCSVLSLLAACAPIQPVSTPPVPAEPVTVTHLSVPFPGPIYAAEKALLAQVPKKYPHITIDSRSGALFPLMPYITGDNPTNLIFVGVDTWLRTPIRQGKAVDLTDLWDKTGFAANYPEKFAKVSEVDGKQYVMPYGYSWVAIYYNKAVFAEHNLTPPQDWEEFLVICETLKQAGETPITIGGMDPPLATLWFDHLSLRINGADYHRKLQIGQIPFTDEGVRKVLEVWSDMFAKGYFVERPTGVSIIGSLSALSRDEKLTGEKAVMSLSGSFFMEEFPAALREELGFFSFPIIDPAIPRTEIFDLYGYVLPNHAANLDAAIAVAEVVASAEAQQKITNFPTNFVPARTDIDLSGLSEEAKEGKAMIESADALVPWFMFNQPESIWGKVYGATEVFFLKPENIDKYIESLEAARLEAVERGEYPVLDK